MIQGNSQTRWGTEKNLPGIIFFDQVRSESFLRQLAKKFLLHENTSIFSGNLLALKTTLRHFLLLVSSQ